MVITSLICMTLVTVLCTSLIAAVRRDDTMKAVVRAIAFINVWYVGLMTGVLVTFLLG